MEDIKKEARKDAENIWENKLQNDFTEKINQGHKEILSILNYELNQLKSNIYELFCDLDKNLDEEFNPKSINKFSEFKQIDNNNNKFIEIQNINNNLSSIDNIYIFNKENNYNKSSFVNKINENKKNFINNTAFFESNMTYINNDIKSYTNNNDNIESNELRKQKVDFSKFNSPPLIILVEPNNSNPLINLIFRCLSNILIIITYYFNPNREEIILKKSREDTNGIYLGPSFIKLLDNIWKTSKKEYCPLEFHIALKKLMGNNYYSNNPGYIMEFILNQLDKELNFIPFENEDDNDDHLDQTTSFKLFFKQFEKYQTKISNCSFSTIKTQKKCSFCQKSTYYFHMVPVVNIILESTNEDLSYNQSNQINKLNLNEHLNNLLLEKKDENINEYCNNCKNQTSKYIMKEIFLAFNLIIFYINREKDPECRLSFNYPEVFDGKKLINKAFDLYNYQLITVIKKNPNENNNYVAYCKSFINNKWYSYYKRNISSVKNTNEIFDNKNACLLIYSEMKS